MLAVLSSIAQVVEPGPSSTPHAAIVPLPSGHRNLALFSCLPIITALSGVGGKEVLQAEPGGKDARG